MRESDMRNVVMVSNRQRRFRLDARRVAEALDQALQCQGLADCELSVLFVGPRTMRRLNHDYRGKDEKTDVLSFAMEQVRGPGPRVLGDLVLCLDVLESQARQTFNDGRPVTGTLARELALLSVHGLLHLLGHDHEAGRAKAVRMLAAEKALFEAVSGLFPEPERVSKGQAGR